MAGKRVSGAATRTRGPGLNKIDPERFALMGTAMLTALENLRKLYQEYTENVAWEGDAYCPKCNQVVNWQTPESSSRHHYQQVLGAEIDRLRHGLKARIQKPR